VWIVPSVLHGFVRSDRNRAHTRAAGIDGTATACTRISGHAMGLISIEQFLEHPGQVLADARAGSIALVEQDGEPVLMVVPMGATLDNAAIRLELAVSLFDRGQIGIGVAARIAGLAISELIDELGRRRIPVVRSAAEDLP
jgi:predicted HTH domain antitoxin